MDTSTDPIYGPMPAPVPVKYYWRHMLRFWGHITQHPARKTALMMEAELLRLDPLLQDIPRNIDYSLREHVYIPEPHEVEENGGFTSLFLPRIKLGSEGKISFDFNQETPLSFIEAVVEPLRPNIATLEDHSIEAISSRIGTDLLHSITDLLNGFQAQQANVPPINCAASPELVEAISTAISASIDQPINDLTTEIRAQQRDVNPVVNCGASPELVAAVSAVISGNIQQPIQDLMTEIRQRQQPPELVTAISAAITGIVQQPINNLTTAVQDLQGRDNTPPVVIQGGNQTTDLVDAISSRITEPIVRALSRVESQNQQSNLQNPALLAAMMAASSKNKRSSRKRRLVDDSDEEEN